MIYIIYIIMQTLTLLTKILKSNNLKDYLSKSNPQSLINITRYLHQNKA